LTGIESDCGTFSLISGSYLLQPMVAQRFDGAHPCDAFMFARRASTASLMVLASSRFRDPNWTVISGPDPCEYFAIIH
jgi:hypothetical protein